MHLMMSPTSSVFCSVSSLILTHREMVNFYARDTLSIFASFSKLFIFCHDFIWRLMNISYSVEYMKHLLSTLLLSQPSLSLLSRVLHSSRLRHVKQHNEKVVTWKMAVLLSRTEQYVLSRPSKFRTITKCVE